MRQGKEEWKEEGDNSDQGTEFESSVDAHRGGAASTGARRAREAIRVRVAQYAASGPQELRRASVWGVYHVRLVTSRRTDQ